MQAKPFGGIACPLSAENRVPEGQTPSGMYPVTLMLPPGASANLTIIAPVNKQQCTGSNHSGNAQVCPTHLTARPGVEHASFHPHRHGPKLCTPCSNPQIQNHSELRMLKVSISLHEKPEVQCMPVFQTAAIHYASGSRYMTSASVRMYLTHASSQYSSM